MRTGADPEIYSNGCAKKKFSGRSPGDFLQKNSKTLIHEEDRGVFKKRDAKTSTSGYCVL